MKNRALLLCLRSKIETVEEYALKVGCDLDTALGVLNEEGIVPLDVIKRSCELFGCTPSYFLCETEK